MKKSWMIFSLMPVLTFAAYPIYEDDIAPHEPELLTRESNKELAISKNIEKESIQGNGEDKAFQKSAKKPRLKDHPVLRNRRKVSIQAKPEAASSDKQQSAVSKREPAKRNPIPSNSPRIRHRQNPKRPQVIHRDDKKKSQELSKIEADAEDIEEGLSAHPNEEWTDSEP